MKPHQPFAKHYHYIIVVSSVLTFYLKGNVAFFPPRTQRCLLLHKCRTGMTKDNLPSIKEPSTTKTGLKYHYFRSTLTVDSLERCSNPAVLFCNGFRSSMTGTKAIVLEEHCKSNGLSYCRFDYRGHGLSSPETFLEMTLSDWICDAETILLDVLLKDHSQVVLIGSSMGAWIAIHLALRYPDKIAGIVGIAPAVDFTQKVLYEKATDEQKNDWLSKGIAYFPSKYESNPYPITWRFIQDCKEKWQLLDSATLSNRIPNRCPVHLFHGQCDNDIPWMTSLELAERFSTSTVMLTLIKDGDHRLSRPQDIQQISAAIDGLLQRIKTS
ncbi:serine aminopeptidase, S33 [Nitzschia inconspicua]|uniref:Serine aminopeptidase, S33 n=1 Tax=Nitzschia inconspicua TaxID=303405 RepID=A0A9K3L1N9_9STRA|nr:serine aminopeptidase, S33 [Nitzschia inconspicua]